MKRKPYLHCPRCGGGAMRLNDRVVGIRANANRFRCPRYRIPTSCSVIQALSFALGAVIAHAIVSSLSVPYPWDALLMFASGEGFTCLAGYILSFYVPLVEKKDKIPEQNS